MSPAVAGGFFTTSTIWDAPRRWKSDELRKIGWRGQERSLDGLVSGRGDGWEYGGEGQGHSIRGGRSQASEPQEVNPQMGGVGRGVIPE